MYVHTQNSWIFRNFFLIFILNCEHTFEFEEDKTMQIKKLNEEIENLLKENTEDEYAISDTEKAELWDMVKNFDEYIGGNSINEENLNEVLKIDCGLELQLATIDLIPNREKYKLLPYSMSFTKENRRMC